MTSLERIDMSDNLLSGTLSTTIGNLLRLEDLFLDSNFISGTLPTEVGRLQSLSSRFSLWENFLAGTIPTEVGHLTGVNVLDVGANSMSGTIPSEVGNLSSLRLAFLDRNSFMGVLPSELGRLQNLGECVHSITVLTVMMMVTGVDHCPYVLMECLSLQHCFPCLVLSLSWTVSFLSISFVTLTNGSFCLALSCTCSRIHQYRWQQPHRNDPYGDIRITNKTR